VVSNPLEGLRDSKANLPFYLFNPPYDRTGDVPIVRGREIMAVVDVVVIACWPLLDDMELIGVRTSLAAGD
jgi:hypothetical protein